MASLKTQYGIVGYGAAGILLILELIHKGIPPSEITVIDPFFDGGSLNRKWGSIQSNTRWEQIRDSMAHYPSSKGIIATYNEKYTAEQTIQLSELGALLLASIEPFVSQIQTIQGTCTSIIQGKTTPPILNIGKSQSQGQRQIQCEKVFLCQGGIQRSIECGKPTIPLEVALDANLLKRYVKTGQTVSVFGIAHSGTLVIKHLITECGATVHGFYRGEKPFLFARDGHYDGIKQESADIADKILGGTYGNAIHLCRIDNVKGLVQALNTSAWVVSCVGFEGSPIRIVDETTGSEIDSSRYEKETGKICESIYGFGLAYPGITAVSGIEYKDIGIPSFIQQIQKCLNGPIASQ